MSVVSGLAGLAGVVGAETLLPGRGERGLMVAGFLNGGTRTARERSKLGPHAISEYWASKERVFQFLKFSVNFYVR